MFGRLAVSMFRKPFDRLDLVGVSLSTSGDAQHDVNKFLAIAKLFTERLPKAVHAFGTPVWIAARPFLKHCFRLFPSALQSTLRN